MAVVKNIILHIYNKYPYYYILTSDGWQMTFVLMHRRKLDETRWKYPSQKQYIPVFM